MTLTLRLPTALTEELEQQAVRIGVSPEEHATELLLAALRAGEDLRLPGDRLQIVESMLRELLDTGSQPEAVRQRLREIVALLSMSPEGGATSGHGRRNARPSALGQYAHIPGTSEDFARRKQEEIDREDGRAA